MLASQEPRPQPVFHRLDPHGCIFLRHATHPLLSASRSVFLFLLIIFFYYFLFRFPIFLVLSTFVALDNLFVLPLFRVFSSVHATHNIYAYMKGTWAPQTSPPFPPNVLWRSCGDHTMFWPFPPHICLYQICPARLLITLFVLFCVCCVFSGHAERVGGTTGEPDGVNL